MKPNAYKYWQDKNLPFKVEVQMFSDDQSNNHFPAIVPNLPSKLNLFYVNSRINTLTDKTHL